MHAPLSLMSTIRQSSRLTGEAFSSKSYIHAGWLTVIRLCFLRSFIGLAAPLLRNNETVGETGAEIAFIIFVWREECKPFLGVSDWQVLL